MRRLAHQIESIQLPDGWSGLVLAGREGPSGAHQSEPEIDPAELSPDTASLRECAQVILRDPTALDGYTVLKYSKQGEVFRARIDTVHGPLDIVGKQSHQAGLRRGLRARLRGTRERRNFDRALKLLAAGIQTARPLILLQRHRGRREAWLVTAYVPDLIDLDRLLLAELPRLDARRCSRVKSAVSASVVDLLDQLQRADLTHRDFKASNILIHGHDAEGFSPSAWLLDLDGLTEMRWRREEGIWRPIVRLVASLYGYAAFTRTDGCRFLLAYLERRAIPREAWKIHFRRLANGAEDYIRRAKLRKSQKLDGFAGD